jgi:dihydropyrimidinase
MIQDARRAGIRVDTETCPQYLLLTDEVFKDKKRGHLYATCPQVKKQADCDRLWQAVMQGDINVIATDTCTFNQKQKSRWKGDFTKIPYGMPGVETMIPAMYTYGVMPGKITLNRLVQLVCSGPAKQMGMYPRKGTIAIDSDADLIIIDPKKSKKIIPKNLATQCDWSPYEGLTMHGFPETVLSRGQEIVSKGKFTGTRGHGTFIPRRLAE